MDDCDRPVRARGLCGNHYNQAYQRNRHSRTVQIACTHCGEMTEKPASRGRRYKPFCDYTCRDLYMMDNGVGVIWSGGPRKPRVPRLKVHDQPSWPDWMGKSSPIANYECAECSAAFFARPTKLRAERAFCSARCRNAFKARGRRSIKKAKRLQIFERDGYICWMCERTCGPVESFPDPLAPTIDHITPRSRGGTDDADNLACACFNCNSTRQDSWSFPEVAAVA